MSKGSRETVVEVDENSTIEFLEPIRQLKRSEDLKERKMTEGHAIHNVIQRLRVATVKEICRECGFSTDRVIEHVKHHMNLKRPKFRVLFRR
jgi:hypothetical protein